MLATDSSVIPEPILIVAEAGANLVAGAPANVSPAPAKRGMLNLHRQSYGTATPDAVYLFQRFVQWAIGDPVTAGSPSSVGDWRLQ